MPQPTMPSSVNGEPGWFDRFAGGASEFASRAPFFAGCVLLIVLWIPTLFVLDLNTSQLLINTATTIVTFLLVALIQNAQRRADAAGQHKLNAIAGALEAFMSAYADDPATPDAAEYHLGQAVAELRAAVGLEQRETA